jgi:hypothetical protein
MRSYLSRVWLTAPIIGGQQNTILRAVMFAEFMVESFYSRARRIAGYVTVSATPLSDKMADQKTANVTARSIITHQLRAMNA